MIQNIKKIIGYILLILSVASLVSLFFSVKSCKELKEKNITLEENQNVLLKKAESYKTKDGLSVSSVGRLQIERSDVKSFFPELYADLERMNIRVKYIVSSSRLTTVDSLSLTLPNRDTTMIIGQERIEAKKFSWDDPWVKVEGVIFKDTTALSFRNIEILQQVVVRVPKKFLFIKYGTKGFNQKIISLNPHSTIIYSDYIQFTD